MRSAGIRKPERLQVEKGNVSVGDQDLDCHGKELILDKGVYEARIHFDRAGLKVMIEKLFVMCLCICECSLKSDKIKCLCLR